MPEIKLLSAHDIANKIKENDEDFSNSHIFGIDWVGRDLSNYNFNNSKFEWVRFVSCKLIDTDFSDSELILCNFSNADLTRTIFEKTKINLCLFQNSIFNQTNFKKSYIWESAFLDVDIAAADFSNSAKFRFITSIAEITQEDLDRASVVLSQANLPFSRQLMVKSSISKFHSVIEKFKSIYGIGAKGDDFGKNIYQTIDLGDFDVDKESYSARDAYKGEDTYTKTRKRTDRGNSYK